MNDKRKALGRGLESLLPGSASVSSAAKSPEGQEIPVDLIDPNPYQTRRFMKEEALNELAESIKASGVVQPVVVRRVGNDRFQLVAGERRWRASIQAGKTMIPAVVMEISNQRAMEITIIENLQREDLNPMEQGRAFERLGREFGLTQEQMAARTGKERASIANFLRLLKLPQPVQDLIEKGVLTMGHGKALCGLLGFQDQLTKATQEVVEQSLSVRQTEELVSMMLRPDEEGGHQRTKAEKPVDPNVREAARILEQALGLKVEIYDRKGKGKIILKYSSLEDFDRVLQALAAE